MIRRFLVLLPLLIAFAPTALQAARVSPMVVDVQPVGRASVGRVTVTNPDEVEFPVEIVMLRGEISETGELTFTPADDQFLIFPTQTVIPSHGQQVFRLQYVGDPALATSQIYYMSVRQIPVAFKPGPPQVQVVTNFNVLVNVVPENTQAMPVVDSARPAVKEEKPGIEFRVTNNGTRYFSVGNAQWTITATATDGSPVSLKYPSGRMSQIIGVGVVAPGKSRIFFLPTDTALKDGTIEIKLK